MRILAHCRFIVEAAINPRRSYLSRVGGAIGNRHLYWFGVRGADAQVLLDFEQFDVCFSLAAPLNTVSLSQEFCLETLQGARVDLNSYDIDQDASEPLRRLHSMLAQACNWPAVLVPYRPSAFLTSIYFPKGDRLAYLGLFRDHQAMFEHKSWVESQLRTMGVRVIPWRHVADEDWDSIQGLLKEGPVVLRANRSAGGMGLSILKAFDDLAVRWPAHGDGFLCVGPHLDPSIPLNVSACIFSDGTVTLHAPSLQLIGIPSCTTRMLGYCGNDFARIRELDSSVLEELEAMSVTVGRWLYRMGYLGAFGIDALVYDDRVYLSEVNPRFQGSTSIATRISADLGLPDVITDHIAAFLGLEATPGHHLTDLARSQRPMAQVFVYNINPYPLELNPNISVQQGESTLDLLPAPGVKVLPNAILFRLVADRAVTRDGYTLESEVENTVETLATSLFVPAPLLSGASPLRIKGQDMHVPSS